MWRSVEKLILMSKNYGKRPFCHGLTVLLLVLTSSSIFAQSSEVMMSFEEISYPSEELRIFEGEIQNGTPLRILVGYSYLDSIFGYSDLKDFSSLRDKKRDKKKLKKVKSKHKKFAYFTHSFLDLVDARGEFFDHMINEVYKRFPHGMPASEGKITGAEVVIEYSEAPVHSTNCGWGCGFDIKVRFVKIQSINGKDVARYAGFPKVLTSTQRMFNELTEYSE